MSLLLLACGDDGDADSTVDGGDDPGRDATPPPDPDPPPEGATELAFDDPGTDPPDLQPEILSLTYVGGSGDQYVHSVGFDTDGTVLAEGAAFTVRYEADGTGGTVEGDVDAADDGDFAKRPSPPRERPYFDTRSDLTYTVGFRQAGSVQLPIFRAFEGEERIWALWGHAVADVLDANLGADSRCYQAWAMPDGHVGVQCWTDGGNSVLAKDPRDLTVSGFDPEWAAGSFQRSAGGMSTLYARIDPSDGGSVVSGTFVASHVTWLDVDAWGRVYLASVAGSRSGGGEPQNPFGQNADASSGVLVLQPDLKQPLLNARIGGTCSGEGNVQAFGDVAVRGNLLVAGGTTCAPDLATQNAVQSDHGGGQDGMVLVLRLWPE